MMKLSEAPCCTFLVEGERYSAGTKVQDSEDVWWYSEWGMRGWSVLGSVLLMGSGALVWSLLMACWRDSKAYTLFPLH